MPKTRVIELYLDNTYEDKKIGYDVNKLKPRKKEKVNFEPICVFRERKKGGFFSRFRRGKSLILFVNGAKNALRFSKITDKLQPLWTKAEAKEFVKKEMAKAHMEAKPMTWRQFFLILGINIITLVVVFVLANRMGAFM